MTMASQGHLVTFMMDHVNVRFNCYSPNHIDVQLQHPLFPPSPHSRPHHLIAFQVQVTQPCSFEDPPTRRR